MKQVMLVLMIFAVAGLGSGCGNKNKKAPITNADGRTARAGGDGVTASTDINIEGGIYANDQSQDDWQHNVAGFVNAVIPEDFLGFVNGDYNSSDAKTGVVFGGKVFPQGGRITASGAQGRVAITSDSRLLVLVYDEFVGQKDEAGKAIPAIPVYLTSSSGYVEGNRVYLKFWDSRGSIELDGQILGDGTIEAEFDYDNQVRYDGQGQGGAGTLGIAKIRTCSFFQCN